VQQDRQDRSMATTNLPVKPAGDSSLGAYLAGAGPLHRLSNRRAFS
jgi:hypothetical protein